MSPTYKAPEVESSAWEQYLATSFGAGRRAFELDGDNISITSNGGIEFNNYIHDESTPEGERQYLLSNRTRYKNIFNFVEYMITASDNNNHWVFNREDLVQVVQRIKIEFVNAEETFNTQVLGGLGDTIEGKGGMEAASSAFTWLMEGITGDGETNLVGNTLHFMRAQKLLPAFDKLQSMVNDPNFDRHELASEWRRFRGKMEEADLTNKIMAAVFDFILSIFSGKPRNEEQQLGQVLSDIGIGSGESEHNQKLVEALKEKNSDGDLIINATQLASLINSVTQAHIEQVLGEEALQKGAKTGITPNPALSGPPTAKPYGNLNDAEILDLKKQIVEAALENPAIIDANGDGDIKAAELTAFLNDGVGRHLTDINLDDAEMQDKGYVK